MHKLIRVTVLAAVLAGMVAPLSAATPSEFYTGLLRRGMASYDASRYTDAARQLRIAAFGLVEAVDQYQVAQIYLALTLEKLGETDRAREAAHRVAVAEKIERRFGTLALQAPVRSAFDALSARVLSATDAALLRSSSTAPPPAVVPQAVPKPVTKPIAPPPATTQPPVAKPPATTPIVTPPATDPEKPKPQPVPVKPPQTATTKPATATTTTTTKAPTTTKPVVAPTPVAPTPVAPTPVAPTPAPPRTLSASEVASRLGAADRALNSGNLIDARRVYRELLAASGLEHDTLIRIAEGLYRSRDFAGALLGFNRIGTLRRGEEPYRYYIAVALFETGDHARAKKELAAALPYIEITPDVARYRSKIESAL